MTVPTPDIDYDTIWEAGRANGYESGRDEYAHALALATAEREDARREVEHQKGIKAQNAAALVEQLDQARQMLADAPHWEFCPCSSHADTSRIDPECNCWKKAQ
jgi:hypothetical protein